MSAMFWKPFPVLLALLFLMGEMDCVLARPAQIVLLRHAEKPADEKNIHLSAQGVERARALAGWFTNNVALLSSNPPAALFAARPVQGARSQRAMETLEPLGKQMGLPVQTPFAAHETARLAKSVLEDSALDGKTVVICWTRDYLPALAKDLGVVSGADKWKTTSFDRIWLITCRDGAPVLKDVPQKLLPGDSVK